MKKWTGIAWILMSCFLTTVDLWAQPKANASVKFDSTKLLIGDHVYGSIILTTPENKDFIFPRATEIWKTDNVEIISLSDREKQNVEGGRIEVTQKIALVFWDTGTYQLAALPFAFNVNGRSDTIFGKVPEIRVDYPPGITGDSTFIAPIKPILEEKRTFADFLWGIFLFLTTPFMLVILFLIIVAFGIYFFMRWQQRMQERRKKLTPEELALKQLKELLEQNMPQQGEYKEYHVAISLIIREYLYNRFRLKALESTTQDLQQMVNYDHMTERLKEAMIEVLETADLVKYAKASPLEAANDFAAKFIRQLVAETQQRLEDAEEN